MNISHPTPTKSLNQPIGAAQQGAWRKFLVAHSIRISRLHQIARNVHVAIRMQSRFMPPTG